MVALGGPPKSTYKSGISSTTIAKGRHSSSPIPSPPEQSGPSASPLRTVNVSKIHTSTEDNVPTQLAGKDKATASSDREILSRTTGIRETVGRKGNIGAKPTDLQSMLVTLLMENPKGMSLKVGRQNSDNYYIDISLHLVATCKLSIKVYPYQTEMNS